MKPLISLLVALLLCFGCLVPAFAEDAAESAQTTEAAKTSEEPALPEAYLKWAHGGQYDDRGAFDRSFRQYYSADPDVKIIDHMVYLKAPVRRWSSNELSYRLIDFFDSDETEAAATQLYIPFEIDGLPVTPLAYDKTIPLSTDADAMFSNNTVKKVTFAEGFTAVPWLMFRNFTALKTVVLPSTMQYIGRSAFENCAKLKTVTGAVELKSVEAAAFKGCKKLSVLDGMETLELVLGEAFRGCAFQSLTLPGFLRIFGPDGDMDYYSDSFAFADCKKLKSVTFLPLRKGYQLWIGASAFRNCTALESVTLPKKCGGVSILHRTFQGCTALKTLNTTKKLETIGGYAFAGSGLERLVLTENAKLISEDAFKGCKHLKTLDIRSSDIDLFGRNYFLYGRVFYGNLSEEESDPTTNFVKNLPKSCTVLVPTLEMKQAAQLHDCTCKVKIKVRVDAPKKLKTTQKGSAVTLKWSTVKDADGYRLYAVNAETGKLAALKTVAAPTTSLTLKTSKKSFAVRAFRTIDGDTSWSKTITN